MFDLFICLKIETNESFIFNFVEVIKRKSEF